jgi:hypothetical protein
VAAQEHHHFTDFFLVRPGLANLFHPVAADSLDLAQPLDLLVDHSQRLFAELFHNAVGHHRADSLDQARPQVFTNPIHGRGHDGFIAVHLELLAVAAVLAPAPLQPQHFAGRQRHEVAHCGHRIPAAGNLHPDHAVTVFLAGVGDPFHLSLDRFRHKIIAA